MNESKELELLSVFSSEFKEEYDSFERSKTRLQQEYYVDNGSFESVDGEILYCMVRHFKPKRIVEVGSGNSTLLFARAVRKNEQHGLPCELMAVDPHPNETLQAGVPGLSKLVPGRIQDVPLSEFQQLGENDILFIDSSHVSTIGSDVNYLYLEVIPRLRQGVIVHAHDVFLPAEYPKEWTLRDHHFWTEQYLLHAFLLFNNCFEVLWAGSYMHLKYPSELEAAFSSYKRNERWPGSFWMRRVS